MAAAENHVNNRQAPQLPPPPFVGDTSGDGLDMTALVAGAEAGMEVKKKPRSKKSSILDLYDSGTTDLAEIVRLLGIKPSYVGQVLQENGRIEKYFDLYTSNSDPENEMNVYAKFFRGVLAFKTVAAAEESVEKLSRLFEYFSRLNDHAGTHHCQVLALTGMNRARSMKKLNEANVFFKFLFDSAMS